MRSKHAADPTLVPLQALHSPAIMPHLAESLQTVLCCRTIRTEGLVLCSTDIYRCLDNVIASPSKSLVMYHLQQALVHGEELVRYNLHSRAQTCGSVNTKSCAVQCANWCSHQANRAHQLLPPRQNRSASSTACPRNISCACILEANRVQFGSTCTSLQGVKKRVAAFSHVCKPSSTQCIIRTLGCSALHACELQGCAIPKAHQPCQSHVRWTELKYSLTSSARVCHMTDRAGQCIRRLVDKRTCV